MLEAVELADFGGQTAQLIGTEVKVLEAVELDEFEWQTTQLIGA